jgi:branched-chain amino acid transport system substrate-binding protein
MSAPISDDGTYSEQNKDAPEPFRQRPRMPAASQFYVPSAPTVPTPSDVDEDQRRKAELASRPERVFPEPPLRRTADSTMTLVGRIAKVVSFAVVVALLTIFAKPLWQGARALLDADSQTLQRSDRVTANNAPANSTLVAPTTTAAVPAAESSASAQGQQASSLPPNSRALGQEPSGTVRGVTDSEIRFGISAPFSGATKELGQNMRLGIETAFRAANASGGVYGRQLRLVAVDDGYEPARTAATMKQLYEKDQVFGVIGNVGTPTAVVALPYALERRMLFFGAFTGAGLLRSNPPDRYVFNYRASYAEETASVVNYLVKVRHIRPTQIAVFAQQDAYGDAGFSGVAKAIRSLGGNDGAILRLNYQRNTIDVDDAVEQLRRSRIPIRAIIMVPAYRAAAKFIEKTRDAFPDMIYTSVSFVGSTALANELMLLGKRFANGVIVTQVVPAVDGHSSLVLDYKTALAKYFPGEPPDYVSLEGYVAASVLISALKRNGPELDTEKLVQTLENLQNLDIGLGTPVNFGRSEHQGVHKVWGTQLDATGHYQPVDLE